MEKKHLECFQCCCLCCLNYQGAREAICTSFGEIQYLGWKSPVKIGSVCPSFHPSFHLFVSFLRIGSLVFPET